MRPQGPVAIFIMTGILCTATHLWAANAPVSTFSPTFSPAISPTSGGLAGFETAAGGDIRRAEPQAPSGPAKNHIFTIQEELANQGFYLGPIDGRMGLQTEAAIRAYQASADLKVDGKATENLARDLVTGGQVNKLLKRLEDSRARTIERARDALLANPKTRNLLEEQDQLGSSTGEPNTKACMANPKPRCLLIEAASSARDIDKPEMRDWALGEILAAQARSGFAQDATATTRRIHDPRLIMVALRDIAKARAESGELEDALAAVDIIPDAYKQAEAYIHITEIQAQENPQFDPAQTEDQLGRYLDNVPSALSQISLYTRIAGVLAKAGFEPQAIRHIEAAERLLADLKTTEETDKALRYIAASYAESGMAKKALEVLGRVENGSADTPVLVAAATGLAQSGEASAALITADSIETVRYRALVLARIAAFQGGAGLIDEARETLVKAKKDAAKIKFPFAKAYAFSRISLAYNDVSISAAKAPDLFEQSVEAAHLITDERLKAHIFWTIADERRRAADLTGATRAQDAADTATDDILSPFSRVWMLCDIAIERTKRLENDGAWSVFNLALDEAKTIRNPWGRARALSKVAATMTTLMDQTAQTAQTSVPK
ncbi:peptidoglycan-binding domain-containing protein [Magnetovibrio sp. PR-2]|uniref:peptidoglycan-binding domain-containing protein n=1 Tax=Magnetovibrio sp. PR-2 TaxID=3120356 RepID=UPI002FCE26EB